MVHAEDIFEYGMMSESGASPPPCLTRGESVDYQCGDKFFTRQIEIVIR
ncbi:MAG: hypothetical protein MJZ47_04270 [Bacteroidales bacterium]|nr:hypothetical protein [Bacteroidales bacterium]